MNSWSPQTLNGRTIVTLAKMPPSRQCLLCHGRKPLLFCRTNWDHLIQATCYRDLPASLAPDQRTPPLDVSLLRPLAACTP